jgi:hypothetical protein
MINIYLIGQVLWECAMLIWYIQPSTTWTIFSQAPCHSQGKNIKKNYHEQWETIRANHPWTSVSNFWNLRLFFKYRACNIQYYELKLYSFRRNKQPKLGTRYAKIIEILNLWSPTKQETPCYGHYIPGSFNVRSMIRNLTNPFKVY